MASITNKPCKHWREAGRQVVVARREGVMAAVLRPPLQAHAVVGTALVRA